MLNKQMNRDRDELTHVYLARQKFVHIIKAARSATAANILAPLLCIPMFKDEVREPYFQIWLGYMFVAIFIRTAIIYGLEHKAEKVVDPQRDLKKMAFAVGIAGLGWGLGWPLMTPDLTLVNRMIYVYMTTAAMISGMFAYSVDRRTFYSFTLPIMVPAVSTIMWPVNIFPWPFAVGLIALYFIVLSIAKNFSLVFSESVNLRFGNERLYKELADERDQSIAANVAKSKFIAVASHDLRQPLHAINIVLELFRLPDLKERDVNLVRRVKDSVAALNNMFEALLNMSRLDSYATSVDNTIFSLSDLSDEIKAMAEPRATAKGLIFSMNSPALHIKGDRFLLQQMVMNLVMNAIQYTKQGEVGVIFSIQDGRLTIDVTDSGVGISSEDQAKIFNEFYRAEHTRSAHEGLGLGLSIVQRICRLINASIEVKSTIDHGSVFKVTTNCFAADDQETLTSNDSRTAKKSDEFESLLGKSIAIIEDDGIIADAYRQTLLALGANIVVLSEHDAELQQQIESIDRIDCILSDYHLRTTTGIHVIEKMREHFNMDIPAVMVTGDTSPEHMEAFSKFNAVILYKPLTLGKIAESIGDAIRGA